MTAPKMKPWAPRASRDYVLEVLSALERNKECLEWKGRANNHGYGLVSVFGKDEYVHRLAWFVDHGPIEPGMYVCHKCDNPACARSEHLFLGTPKDNQHDAYVKGRIHIPAGIKITHCQRGHEFSPENTRIRKGGKRLCLACERLRDWIRRHPELRGTEFVPPPEKRLWNRRDREGKR